MARVGSLTDCIAAKKTEVVLKFSVLPESAALKGKMLFDGLTRAFCPFITVQLKGNCKDGTWRCLCVSMLTHSILPSICNQSQQSWDRGVVTSWTNGQTKHTSVIQFFVVHSTIVQNCENTFRLPNVAPFRWWPHASPHLPLVVTALFRIATWQLHKSYDDGCGMQSHNIYTRMREAAWVWTNCFSIARLISPKQWK